VPHTILAAVLVGHGLITSAIGFGAVTKPNAPSMAVPSWLAWPSPFGRSWLVEALSLGTGGSILGGIIWLVGGLLLVAGGLGWFGVDIFESMRVPLLLAGAATSLVALVIYFHPLYLLAIVINVAIVVLLWSQFSAARGAA
jgi:hypothetical protein